MENQEVINYLLAHNDLKIIQRKDMFNFSFTYLVYGLSSSVSPSYKEDMV